jgi:hypothetical protein
VMCRRHRWWAGGVTVAGARAGSPAAERDRRWGKCRGTGARVPSGWRRILSLPIGADSRPFSIRRTRAKGCAPGRPQAVTGRAAKASGASSLPRRARRAQNRAVGRQRPQAEQFYHCYFFSTVHSFNCFCSVFLGKFHTVFSIQIIPTKVCLENSKVTETFL